MNLSPRAANQLHALPPEDVARILDDLRDRAFKPGASLIAIECQRGTYRAFVARHKDGSLVLLAVVASQAAA